MCCFFRKLQGRLGKKGSTRTASQQPDNTGIALPTTQLIGTIDNTKTLGLNPIQIKSVEYLGFQVATNSCSHRDLGFTGRIGKKWYAVFGDTLWCAPGVIDAPLDPPGFHGMVRDSVSLLTDDPLRVIDLHLNDDRPVPHQRQLVPFNPAWGEKNTTAFGGTSLCETDAKMEIAVLYYLVVSPPVMPSNELC